MNDGVAEPPVAADRVPRRSPRQADPQALGVMSISAHEIATGSNEQVMELLGKELESRLPSRNDPEFLIELRKLPPGLRAMAATYELDVSLCMDDLGWHFGNWHDQELAEETAGGLEELGAKRSRRTLSRSFWSCEEILGGTRHR